MSAQTNAREHTKNRIKKPSLYHVVMHNDDFTTMEFVVEILITQFLTREGRKLRL